MSANAKGSSGFHDLLSPMLMVMLLPCAVLPYATQAQMVTPVCVPALQCPSPRVEGLSVYAPMADASGTRQVTVSFRIVNHGVAPTSSGSTTVLVAGSSTVLATPRLMPGETAFFSTTANTSATDFGILVTAPSNNTASYHFIAALPTLGRWRPLGPSVIMNSRGSPEGVGRITTIAVDPSSTDIVYAGARASGLWKTTDGGAHWYPLTDALPTVNIYAVAVDAINHTHVFITTPAGVFASTDGGQVWRLLNSLDLQAQGSDGGAFIARGFAFVSFTATSQDATSGIAASTPAIAVATVPTPFSTHLYLTTQNGLVVSLDGGVNWSTPVLGGGAIVESLEQDRFNPDHMLATVVSHAAPLPPSSSTGVYETYSGGLTPGSWHKLQGCPQGPAPNFSLAFFPQNGQIWATLSGTTQWISDRDGTDHELWRTTGETCMVNGFPEHGWQLLSSGTQTPCIGIGADGQGPSSEWSFLHADPTNAQILYKAGVKLCRSTDAGVTFREVPALHDDQHALVFHPAAVGILFEGNDGGLYRSLDGGQSWAFDSVGLSVSEFLDTDHGGRAPRVLLGSAQDNGISATDLTTPVWQLVDINGDGDRTTAVVDPLDPGVQYSVGQAVDHLTIIQNGVAASLDSSGLPTNCLTYSESPALFTQFIATSNSDWHLLTAIGPPTPNGPNCNGGLWAGPPWTALFAPSGGESFTRIAYDPANGLFLAGGSRGSIYISSSPTLMAKVWNAPSGAVTAIVPDPTRTANYFVSLGNASGPGRVFEISPNGPQNFNGQDITGNLPSIMVMTLASNPFESGVLYAGTNGQGVFRGTRDSTGKWKWQPFNNGLPQGAIVTKLRMGTDGTLYVATWGRGAFALDTVPNNIF